VFWQFWFSDRFTGARNPARLPQRFNPVESVTPPFLSPCLAEADAVRRVLPPEEFARWFDAFLPDVRLQPERVTDPGDGKLAHLDGLNLSRAWMLEGIAAGLPQGHPRRTPLLRLAGAHRGPGLASVTSERYEGAHWLGSFATYLMTGRALPR
jgi:hypothetical protein